jgi:hypothetical protein
MTHIQKKQKNKTLKKQKKLISNAREKRMTNAG